MKIGDYFLVSDLQRLSEEQYNALLLHLKFIGLDCEISYEEFEDDWQGHVIIAWHAPSGPKLLWAYTDDEDIVECLSYDDILRMISLAWALE